MYKIKTVENDNIEERSKEIKEKTKEKCVVYLMAKF